LSFLEHWLDDPMMTDPDHPYYNIIQQNPCALRNMTANAFDLSTIDGLVKTGDCVYELSEAHLVNATLDKKLEKRAATIQDFSEELTKLINDNKKFTYTPLISANLKSSLDDKFESFEKYTEKQIFVLNKEISFFLDKSEYQSFADEVASSCSAFLPDEMLLVCIPFFKGLVIKDVTDECWKVQHDESRSEIKLYPFQAYVGHQADEPKSVIFESSIVDIGLGSYQDVNFYKFCLDFYKEIPKPHLPIYYYLFTDGKSNVSTNMNIIQDEWKDKDPKKGYDAIVDVKIFYDERIDSIRMLEDQITGTGVIASTGMGMASNNGITISQLYNKISAIRNNPHTIEIGKWKLYDKHRLKEIHALDNLDAEKANHFEYMGSLLPDIYSDAWFVDKWSNGLPNEALFPVNWNEEIFIAIDVASIVLIPFNLDFIAEAGGLSFALYQGDYLNASIYATGLALVGVPAVTGKNGRLFKEQAANGIAWSKTKFI